MITTTRWNLPTDASTGLVTDTGGPRPKATTCLAVAVDAAPDCADAVAALRAWQLAAVSLARATDDAVRRANAPFLWAALSTHEIPDRAVAHIPAPGTVGAGAGRPLLACPW